jgi:dimethylamine corrinoid protein
MSVPVPENGIIGKLKHAILTGDYNETPKITQEGLDTGVDLESLLQEGIVNAIKEIETNIYGNDKVFHHPDLLLGMECVRRSMAVLEPFINKRNQYVATVVMGVPAGDTHDFGTKYVALALTAAGFNVIYLGRDVPTIRFVQKITETNASILMISCYQTTGFNKIKEIMRLLQESKINDRIKVVVGGTAVTEKMARMLNLAYGRTASEAITLASEFTKEVGK